MSNDPTEATRRQMVDDINANPGDREVLETKHGQVWDTTELQQQFEVLAFMAPFVIVREKSTGTNGSLEFQHGPRYYYSFKED